MKQDAFGDSVYRAKMVGVLDGLSLSGKAQEFIWWAEGEPDKFWSRAR